MNNTVEKKKGGKILDVIETVGNKLPHPYIMFLWLCLILAGISTVCSLAGVQVINPTTGETVLAKAIFSRDGIVWLLENLLKNFQGFSALGLVLAMQMAIGFAEGVGLLTAAMRKAILGVPLWALTATVLFLGINGSIASEAAIIVVPALAAAAFQAVGMHPIAGLLAGYAATNAGFTACLIVSGTDVLLCGVTELAAQLVDPSITVNATANWYFMIVSVFMLTAVGVVVNKYFIVPRLGMGVDMNPVTSGPKVNESLETNIEGVFACGNVLHVHDLVDFVSEEAAIAGKNAAAYVKQGENRPSGGHEIVLKPIEGVRYTVPGTIDPARMDEELTVRFRVGGVYKNCYVSAYFGDERVIHRKRPVVAPGEMEELKFKKADFLKYPDLETITVKIEEA